MSMLQRKNLDDYTIKYVKDVARLKGYQIIDSQSTPYHINSKLSIDMVFYNEIEDVLIFVGIREFKRPMKYDSCRRKIDKRKVKNINLVCNAWLKRYHWDGKYRFDIIELHGNPSKENIECDYIENVILKGEK